MDIPIGPTRPAYLHATPARRTRRIDLGDVEVLLNRSKGNVADIRADTNRYAQGPSLPVFPLLSPVLFQMFRPTLQRPVIFSFSEAAGKIGRR